MRGGKTKKSKSSSRSTMGRLLPPVDVQNTNQLDELDKRISMGPLTLVLVYADWCGHCQKFKPVMKELENCPGRTVQTARIREDVFPNSSISSAKIEGYPTLMLVKKNGEVTQFKNDQGEVTNAIPDHGDLNKMKILVRNAGKPEGTALLETPSLSEKSNATVNVKQPSPNIPKNILADRLSEKSVERLNTNLMNSSNSLLKNATVSATVQTTSQKGGSLWSQLAAASRDIGPAAALFFGATVLNKTRRAKKQKTKARRKSKVHRK